MGRPRKPDPLQPGYTFGHDLHRDRMLLAEQVRHLRYSNALFQGEVTNKQAHTMANRTGLAPGKTPLEVERRLTRLTPDEFKKDAHHWLILHGRYVCKARKPRCRACPIIEWCEYRYKELP